MKTWKGYTQRFQEAAWWQILRKKIKELVPTIKPKELSDAIQAIEYFRIHADIDPSAKGPAGFNEIMTQIDEDARQLWPHFLDMDEGQYDMIWDLMINEQFPGRF